MLKKALLLSLMIGMTIPAFAQKYRAKIKTTSGDIMVVLYDETPQHRDNFVKLAKEHFYDSTLFHRVISGFMIQGGDPDSKTAAEGARLGSGGLDYRVPAEIKPELFHKRGALAAARDNNPEKASSSCQFYIVDGKKFTAEELEMIEQRTNHQFTEEQKKIYETKGGSPHLDGNYTVYGEVIKGMDVVDKIANSEKDRSDRPLEDQRILKLRVQKKFLFFYL